MRRSLVVQLPVAGTGAILSAVEQNFIILTYATTDGDRYFRKERALTSFTDVRDTTAALDADPANLGSVDDPDLQEQYATEARRMADVHDPDDVI